jgi:hypothetical protein
VLAMLPALLLALLLLLLCSGRLPFQVAQQAQ